MKRVTRFAGKAWKSAYGNPHLKAGPWLAAALALLVLAGCNFAVSDDEPPQPTVVTPVAWATPATEAPEATQPTAVAENPTPAPGAEPTDTPPASSTPPPSHTPLPSATDTPDQLSTLVIAATHTALPTSTDQPTAPPTFTPIPTSAAQAGDAPEDAPSATPPTVWPSAVPEQEVASVPTQPPPAQVCASCGNLRLRGAPGTAGTILTHLDAYTPLTIIGRTADNAWVQVVLGNGSTGWVSARYLDINTELGAVAVTGEAENVPTSVAPPPAQQVTTVSTTLISGISSNARQIYLTGRARGNRGNVFTKVGDSITWAPGNLYPFVMGYNLADHAYLSPAVNFFAGPNGRGENSFGAQPIAAFPGWTTDHLLSPSANHNPACGAGETPVECAYRVDKPAVAIIMIGTNDSVTMGISMETYRANLQRVVEISINNGVIPVLSTIPPLTSAPVSDRINTINQTIRATARAYDVPLVDYYAALNSLPRKGLGADGVHPSSAPGNLNGNFDADSLNYGFPMRNLLTLQVLYELWRQVLYDAGTAPPSAPVQQVAVSTGGDSETDPDTSTGGETGADTAPDNPGNPGNSGSPDVADVGPVDTSTYTCAGAPALRLSVGQQGRITPGLPNKLRAGPSITAASIGQIPGEAAFSVTGGPVCADGYTWWKVSYNGQEGWTASGNSEEYWVEPAT